MNNLLSALKPYFLRLLVVPPIIAGMVILAIAVQNRGGPEKVLESESARTLRVIAVEQMDFQPRAIGYGTARPSQVWKAIAEVKGRVVELNPELESGSFIQKDALLVRVDDTDTKLAISRLEAEIAKVNSNLAELTASRENYEASVELEQEALKVAEQEQARIEKLVQINAASRAEADSQRRSVLAQRQQVQGIVNSLNLLPAQIQAEEANLAVSKANLAEKNRDLGRIEIRAPFDCRVGPVTLELRQFLASGETLFEVQSTESVEVEAQVAMRQMRKLFDEEQRKQDLASGKLELDQSAIKRYFDVDVVVRYGAGNQRMERKASFERIREELDTQTRSVQAVVSIKDPFKSVLEGPPPASGTYCEVELRGKRQPNRIVIPRSAIWNRHVYVLDKENRLQRHPVTVAAAQSEFAVIESGLQVGETLVVSDPTPAVEGMLVEPVEDDAMSESLRTQAGGEGAIR